MAWFGGKNTWGNFPDLSGAVNKLQESVKNIEKNLDTALGFEEKSESSNEASGSWPLVADRKTLLNPVMSFMGKKVEENTEEMSGEHKSSEQESETEKSLEQTETPEHLPVAEGIESLETDKAVQTETGKAIRTETEESTAEDENKVHEVEEHGDHEESTDGTATLNLEQDKSELPLPVVPVELSECVIQDVESPVSINEPQESETSEVKSPTSPDILLQTPVNFQEDQAAGSTFEPGESDGLIEVRENFLEKIKEESREEERFEAKEGMERVSLVQPEASSDSKEGDDTTRSVASEEINSVGQSSSIPSSSEVAPALVLMKANTYPMMLDLA
ncbi:hypothetical protein K1719_046210 [Acacia pycnantha]|nr:hypothetical protein K1719_046210 [Acacia pycnantha]